MKPNRTQSGATLVVALIMLVVLTLLVTSAIRSSTTNLRIAGNTQVQNEAAAAAQQAIEQILDGDFTSTPAGETITVDNGAATYTVEVATPACNNSVPITSDELTNESSEDLLCFGDGDALPVIDKDGKQIFSSAKCNKQVWELEATVKDPDTGAYARVTQGISKRIYLPTSC